MSKTPINTLLKWLAVADMFVMIEYIPFTIYMYIFPGKVSALIEIYLLLCCDSSGSETTERDFYFHENKKKTKPLWAMDNIPWNQIPNATRSPLSA